MNLRFRCVARDLSPFAVLFGYDRYVAAARYRLDFGRLPRLPRYRLLYSHLVPGYRLLHVLGRRFRRFFHLAFVLLRYCALFTLTLTVCIRDFDPLVHVPLPDFCVYAATVSHYKFFSPRISYHVYVTVC